ncbi:MAG: excinuclease ABC subunit C [Gemmatimonadetes bacterium]|nr:excinuclease ABC subunit C [Gemmatimonadota bacterium]
MEVLKVKPVHADMGPKEARKQLLERLQHLPDEHGVYIMRDREGIIIYIGKAKSLRNRANSYFRPRGYDGRPQFRALVRSVWTMDYIVTDTEVEALILEANLIKTHKPKYNINLKDDKKYPFVRITKEPFPRILLTRDVVRDGSRYLGPYSDVKSLRRTLKSLSKLFKVRSCDFDLPCKPAKLCLDYEINRCDGPCEGLISEADYGKIIDEAVLFLTGRHKDVVRTLKNQMKKASADLKFEDAAEFRDRLQALENVTRRQKVVTHDLSDWDTVALAKEDNEACAVIMEIRDGRLIGRQHYFLSGVLDKPMEEVSSNFLRLFYSTATFVPREINLRYDTEDRETILDWLRDQTDDIVEIRIPQRGEKERLLKMAENNASLLLMERRLKRENRKSQVSGAVAALQRDLKLKKPPKRIEAVDISNTQGSKPVASLVCFVNGKPLKKDYRHFQIHGIDGPNDYAMMEQVVTRRFKRLLEENGGFPDLLLIDGGKGQLSSALKALKSLGIQNQPVIGLAKRMEEVFLPCHSDPQNIPKDSSSIRLLREVRDESHRFAVTYHRKLRKIDTIKSDLDLIDGIGPNRRNLLLTHFGSKKKVLAASKDEIAALKGIGPILADTIYRSLHGTEQTSEVIQRAETL